MTAQKEEQGEFLRFESPHDVRIECAILRAGGWGRSSEKREVMLMSGDAAPNFRLPVLGESECSGGAEERTLEEALARGSVLLAFVKEGCPTCRYSLPFLEKMYQNYQSSGVAFLLVAQEDEAKALELVRNSGIQIPVLLDLEPYLVSSAYQLQFVPTFFYISREGEVEDAIESFHRDDLDRISQKIASAGETDPLPLYQPLDGVPEFRPG